jgi:hypothetical protein
MTFDMATDPAIAVDDDTTAVKAGWRGLKISYLRFDLNEDPAFGRSRCATSGGG